MKVKTLSLLAGMLLAGSSVAMADQHPLPPDTIAKLPPQQQQCRVCHQQTTPKVYKEWARSKHAVANVRCFQCHGTLDDFHKTPPIEKCMACHYHEVETMQKKAPGMKCWTCHTPHVFQFHGDGVKNIKSAKDFNPAQY
ncbi:MAG: hypothetical protein GXO58_04495 [Thermodesulfobacteria bacterium]|nr:hypothetical protein [Thermodesulfobacteriota bacterium]